MTNMTFTHTFPSGKTATGSRSAGGKTETIENEDELHIYTRDKSSVVEKVFLKHDNQLTLVSHQKVSRTPQGSVRLEELPIGQ